MCLIFLRTEMCSYLFSFSFLKQSKKSDETEYKKIYYKYWCWRPIASIICP